MDDVIESVEDNPGQRGRRLSGVQHRKEDKRHCCLVLSKLSLLECGGDDEETLTLRLTVPPIVGAIYLVAEEKGFAGDYLMNRIIRC